MSYYDYSYEFFLFSLQQYIADLLILSRNSFSPFLFVCLFVGGLLTSITPCFISVIPLTIAYFNFNDLIYKNIFLLGLLTNLCFTVCFTSLLSYRFLYYINIFPLIFLFILILLSLNVLQVFNISSYFLYINFSLFDVIYNRVFLKQYLSGFLMGLSTLPCSSPIIIIINIYLSNFSQLSLYLIYLFTYLFGIIFSFFFIFNVTLDYLKLYFLSNIWNTIMEFSAFILLIASLFVFIKKMLNIIV